MIESQQLTNLKETLAAALADVKATTFENVTLKAQLAAAKHYIAVSVCDPKATEESARAWKAFLSTLNAQLSTQ